MLQLFQLRSMIRDATTHGALANGMPRNVSTVPADTPMNVPSSNRMVGNPSESKSDSGDGGQNTQAEITKDSKPLTIILSKETGLAHGVF